MNVFSIFRGNNKTILLKAVNPDCTADQVVNSNCNVTPLDLTACTEIDIALPNADGSVTHLLKSTGQVVVATPTVLGKFSAAITNLVSAVLNLGVYQDFDVTFTIGSAVFTIRYEQALSVFEIR